MLVGLSLTTALVASVSATPITLTNKNPPSRTWTDMGFVPNSHRLIGLGCGEERLTYTAVEEDHFPAPCYAIGTMEELCPTASGDYPPDMIDCVLYLWDGW